MGAFYTITLVKWLPNVIISCESQPAFFMLRAFLLHNRCPVLYNMPKKTTTT